jgi:hypothetical protein
MVEDPEESEIGETRLPETRDLCTRESRYAILQYNQDHPSEGQVLEIKRHRHLTHRKIGISEDKRHGTG